MEKMKRSGGATFRAIYVLVLILSLIIAATPAVAQDGSSSVSDPFGGLKGVAPEASPKSSSPASGAESSSIGQCISGFAQMFSSFGKMLSGLFSGICGFIQQFVAGLSSGIGNFLSSLLSSCPSNLLSSNPTNSNESSDVSNGSSNSDSNSTSSSSGANSSSNGGSSSSASGTQKSADSSSAPGSPITSGGSANAANVVRCAEKYINSKQFRGAEVNYGTKACAQFVSTALKDAGVLNRVYLGVPDLVTALKGKGYSEVSAPPFKAGDVVTWRTYDRNGDGKKDNDTHVGIMCMDGKALSNSSSQRMPRKHDVFYAPICRVLRAS